MISTRATCDRLSVGAVIVKDHRILTTGYNGSLFGSPHCNDVGHLMVDNHCKRSTHAEINAITQAANNGVAIRDSQIYITHAPCMECFRTILAAGITRIHFSNLYKLTQKHIDLYNEIAGYRSVYYSEPGSKNAEFEKHYNWNVALDTKVWYRQ
jgi:deoxycytidylate deaminase